MSNPFPGLSSDSQTCRTQADRRRRNPRLRGMVCGLGRIDSPGDRTSPWLGELFWSRNEQPGTAASQVPGASGGSESGSRGFREPVHDGSFRRSLWVSFVIHNSVVLPAADQVKADFAGRDLVCFSGTLVEKKGVFSLAQAWSLVKQRRPNARLMLIGKDGGHCGRPAIQVIRELAGNYADSIDCLGHRPKAEVEALLATADIAVYPSYSETFALAPMEAMALCVPTIYTTRASGPELIRHGIDGWLCDPGNINDLASQIVTLLESESLRRQLGEAGRRRIIDSCSYSAFLQKNLNFYRRCIGQSHLCAGAAN